MAPTETDSEHRTSNDTAKIRILAVDDHPAILESFEKAFASEVDMVLCGAVASASEALSFLDEHAPEVAIIDLSLGESHGFSLITEALRKHPKLSIVVFSMFDEQLFAQRAVEAGARAYVMKREPVARVKQAILTATQNNIYLSPQMRARLVNSLSTDGDDQLLPCLASLTNRELMVFQLIGEGYNLTEISDRLNLSQRTIDACRRQTKEKLNLDSTRELLYTATEWFQGHSNTPNGMYYLENNSSSE